MAKKTQPLTLGDDFYLNEENHPLISKLFVKIKSDITIFQAITAHKKFFSDPTKPPTEEEMLEYFNNL
jgi:hypothetical protein